MVSLEPGFVVFGDGDLVIERRGAALDVVRLALGSSYMASKLDLRADPGSLDSRALG